MRKPSMLSAPSFLSGLEERVPCADNPLIFHPAQDVVHTRGFHRRAKDAVALCRSCPVATDCRQWARQYGEFGIWGGETDAERKAAGFRSRVRGISHVHAQEETHAGAPEEEEQRPLCLTLSEELVLDGLRSSYDREGLNAELGLSRRAVARAIGGLCRKLHTDEAGIVSAAHAAGLFLIPSA